ncbi:MAG: lipoprotein-releasing ABC transporter permease subunit [Rhodospirillaceae bacterium]|nr:lipoprotein-releasing ABC transporter permease subunit [Rhodospirillaceae bacterium]MBL6930862.1 lipoprotein-releasing ABC transporter permease subunit [Rhodospirillales bacterium]
MFSAFEWMMAMRYLRARRQEGFISVIAWFSLLGIALGVATLIIVMSVMNGFREELLNRILGINGHLSIYGQSEKLTDFDAFADQIRKLDGVTIVTPIIEGQVMASSKNGASGAIVRGFRPDDLRGRAIIADNIQGGSLDSFDKDSVVLGARLARKLGVGIGQDITLISPKGNITAFGTIPRMRNYKVAATFEMGMYEYDSGFVFMDLSAAQIYFKLPEAISNLEVSVIHPDRALEIGQEIRALSNISIRVHDWQRANASFFNAIQVERNVMFLILTLIIVVAAFNIISSMIMLVKDKGRDIAILRTMGASKGTIMRIFFLSGASVGVIGTFSGVLLGLSFANNIEEIRQWIQGLTGAELFAAEIYFLSQLPAVVDPAEVFAVVLMGLGLSFLATLYPSWRAARIDPAEALRYE